MTINVKMCLLFNFELIFRQCNFARLSLCRFFCARRSSSSKVISKALSDEGDSSSTSNRDFKKSIRGRFSLSGKESAFDNDHFGAFGSREVLHEAKLLIRRRVVFETQSRIDFSDIANRLARAGVLKKIISLLEWLIVKSSIV